MFTLDTTLVVRSSLEQRETITRSQSVSGHERRMRHFSLVSALLLTAALSVRADENIIHRSELHLLKWRDGDVKYGSGENNGVEL